MNNIYPSRKLMLCTFLFPGTSSNSTAYGFEEKAIFMLGRHPPILALMHLLSLLYLAA